MQSPRSATSRCTAHAGRHVSFWQRVAASAALSALFLVVYNLTNWAATLRSEVGTWHFDWELQIPFLPLFILPYLSIDLFFVVAPLLCREARELQILAGRMALAILVAGTCFLIWPLTLGFERPHADGLIGAAFNYFLTLDKPHNLVPSLHVALLAILAVHYWRHTRRLPRAILQAWFLLIGLSTLFTHQHHLVDLAGGAVLAVVCFYAVSEAPWRRPVVRNPRVALYYGLGAAGMLAIGGAGWPATSILLWPATALMLASAAYLGLGPAIYRKCGGRLPAAARIVLAPLLLGQYASWLYYRRQCRAWDEAAPGVWIGRVLTPREARHATQQGVTAVLDLTAEFSEAAPLLALPYKNIPVLDLTAPTHDQLAEALRFISEHATTGTVYVHCKIGYSRSAAVVAAWLLASNHAASSGRDSGLTVATCEPSCTPGNGHSSTSLLVPGAAHCNGQGEVDAVLQSLAQVRPSIVVRPEIRAVLYAFQDGNCRDPGKS
jgi:membrane-associated phospholipid phosphatase